MNQLISPEELYTQMQRDNPPTVIDVRSAESYAESHIPGAITIPKDDLEESLDQIPRGRPVVTY
ncbi:MAG: rhodanese-like domain-containing protein [Anaerolineae bacterium]|nr:rhodanese-like domain-containing protein [Anaerolineae bacterium]